jgi:hypothetical protein
MIKERARSWGSARSWPAPGAAEVTPRVREALA